LLKFLRQNQQLFTVVGILSLLVFSNMSALTNHLQDAEKINHATIKRVPTTTAKIALTFDDGPSPLTTLELLTILKNKNVKATFFILGKNGETYPELLQQISLDGHEIANHAYSHTRLAKLSEDDIRAELHRTDAIILNVTGQKTRFVRPPDNSYNNNVVDLVHLLGYSFVLWSVDTRDWSNVSTETILQKITKTQPGDIILFHDGVKPSKTVEALPAVIDALQAKGFELVTVGELLQSN
jgi:peptidoglycan-N-acetylglucosamine deacetylase